MSEYLKLVWVLGGHIQNSEKKVIFELHFEIFSQKEGK